MNEAKLASALARLKVIRAEKAAAAAAAKLQSPTPEESAKIRSEIIQAGIDGGFYDRDDSEYSNVVRDESKKNSS